MRAPPLTSRGKMIVVFASAHLVFLLFGILPVRWRDRIQVSSVFNMYERITRCHQLWNMFETIPNMNRTEARLIVQEVGQKPREVGMVLPGLRRFSQHDQVRLNNWMVNVIFNPTRGVFRESYMESAAEALLSSGRYGPRTQVSLEVIPAYTRSLLGVRSLKEIAVERPSVLGPFELGALVAKKTSAQPKP
ncbi:MAG: hypothetical protein K9N47_22800 [Prosthecobacter sp.]|uniref:hypothetical protein n=1 Tax=Prosthecobacter sp. TaxID=1965333 RepID=UPI0026182595|nr:hypothetical protein [Prosthecobacter sp.]MCF7788972.1 hypothetical protein [Prosthecobacter sp.]